jgi:aminocarboxymuconate-semialdehyde decarboxylase
VQLKRRLTLKIDIFSHIVPKKYKDALVKKTRIDLSDSVSWVVNNRAIYDVDIRLRLVDRNPEVLQVLVPALAPLEVYASKADAVDLAKLNNDESAELVAKYPNKFLAAVALLPLNDIDASQKEAERAITKLKMRGILIYSNINGEPLDLPKFKPLYKQMAKYDLPIWIHPWYLPVTHSPLAKDIPEPIHQYFKREMIGSIQWPVDTSFAMIRLVYSGIFKEYPNIKFITHHCGGVIPFCYGRMGELEDLRKFYNDTALRDAPGALMCGYSFFGADHLLFGTDMPCGSEPYGLTGVTIRMIEQLDIPVSDKEKIFERNALRLLKIGI